MKCAIASLIIGYGAAAPALRQLQGGRWIQAPDGPSQQCRDDAGPPWADDAEHFPFGRYHDGTPAEPVLQDGACPDPLKGACAAKGAKAAYLEGPVQCSGGWFCRIMEQDNWRNPDFGDHNFAHCNASNADESDRDGHCHGSDTDDTYGWWVRDHWFRGYAGTLHCCCGWRGASMEGIVNRCDYRKHVTPEALETCRDANEEHSSGYEDSCGEHADKPFRDPLDTTPGMCWTVTRFADPESVPESISGGKKPPPPPSSKPPPPSPSPPPPTPPPPSPSPPTASPPSPSLSGFPSAASFVGVFRALGGSWTAWARGKQSGGFATGEKALEALSSLEDEDEQDLSPPPPPSPRQGVQVLDGGNKKSPPTTCIDPTSAVTAINGKNIAAQCCDKGGSKACRRVAPGMNNDDEGCIAGHAGKKPPKAMTYAAAQAKCADLGLDMCEESCKNTGCAYNKYPVYTSLECDLN